MKFGVYFHIPYCIQRCSYCDFATYVWKDILPPDQYVDLLLQEMKSRSTWILPRPIDTVFFGGGTPSLLPPNLILKLLTGLSTLGFVLRPKAEVTIEINPATVTPETLQQYLKMGVNRFSVGLQTFNDRLLKRVNREHSAQQTRDTLDLLRTSVENFSVDLLFALPEQSLSELQFDVEELLKYNPPHISPYCLTLKEGHPLNVNRPSDETQIQMFDLISKSLTTHGHERYEISNFAKPGFHSQHNSIYWSDDEYWGIGLSSHSYIQDQGFGIRFWNQNNIDQYVKSIQAEQSSKTAFTAAHLPHSHSERLEFHQSLTDYCHTFLRTSTGLVLAGLEKKFGQGAKRRILGVLRELEQRGWILEGKECSERFFLSEEGLLMSNQVFSQLTFLEGEIPDGAP